jgi:hypothetical protein
MEINAALENRKRKVSSLSRMKKIDNGDTEDFQHFILPFSSLCEKGPIILCLFEIHLQRFPNNKENE